MSLEPALQIGGHSDPRPIRAWSRRPARLPVEEPARRVLEIALALALLLLLCPLLLTVAAAVRATGRSIIFAHRRAGRDGTPFPCYKFRSMVPDAAAVLRDHLAADPDAAREWQQTRKLRNDPRVTPLGHWLRRSSVDELPQLFNVLLGHMSFVGPRPITYDEFTFYGGAARDYLSVKPGLTGLWQVSGRSELSYAERVALDREYARRRSPLFDLVIMARTFPALMRREQAG